MFSAAEKACDAVDASGEETAVFRTAERPCFEPCSEVGLYIVSCKFTADYIREETEK